MCVCVTTGLGKRVRKRRRKKKRAEQQPNIEIVPNGGGPDRAPRTIDGPPERIEAAPVPAESESRPVHRVVVVEVEKIIAPSAPEYCRIVPDRCRQLEAISEETSASDDDPANRRRTAAAVDGVAAPRLGRGLERLESPHLVGEAATGDFANMTTVADRPDETEPVVQPPSVDEYAAANAFYSSRNDDDDDDEWWWSDDDRSTVKQYRTSVGDRLKRIAKRLRDDAAAAANDDDDDYDEPASSAATSVRGQSSSIASDTTTADWMSFTLSDGESSRSLCLSPGQLRSGRAPSTASETSSLIDMHKKFLDRTVCASPPLRRAHVTDTLDILSWNEGVRPAVQRPRRLPPADVLDEACRMCGTSDEPLTDARRLVSLRKYRETRSRLLDVVQTESRSRRRQRQRRRRYDGGDDDDDYGGSDDRSSSPPAADRRPLSMPAAPVLVDTLSVPDRRTRELMYAEYMDKVRERENRLRNKVIRITTNAAGRSAPAPRTFFDVDAEFLTKARQRLDKLGVFVDDSADDRRYRDYDGYYYDYPKHLADIVPADEVCVEEVRTVNGESCAAVFHPSDDLRFFVCFPLTYVDVRGFH